MNKKSTYAIRFILPVLLPAWLLMTSCVRQDRKEIDVDLFFSAEKLSEDGRNMLAENDSTVVFSGAGGRTDITSHSGDYSYITPPNKYALGITIPGVGPDHYVNISIWGKGLNDETHLVAGSTTPKLLYQSTHEAIRYAGDWGMLKLEFFIPPTYTDNDLKIYLWNNSNDTVFFDDLSIRIATSKTYPTYREEAIYIEMDTSEYLKVLDTRKKAFEVGILQTEDDDWVKGFVFGDDKMMKTELRLKGDWLDHLYGDKWSFRLKLKSGNAWKQMRIFSLQTPESRHGVDEWYLHKVLQTQHVLATRYGFVPTYLNNKNLGIYAWEEHFTKNLIESQQKREGPILRFFEDVHWDMVRGKKADIDSIVLPYFDAAVIKPFTTSKVVEDSAMFNQYLIAQDLMLQYKQRTRPASEIFNVDAFAKYLALCDVFQAYHSIIWHNLRFYYNPVLCKLEPIAFDAYTEIGFYDWVDRTFYGDITEHSVGIQDDPYLMMREVFNDYNLLDAYIKYLEKYSEPEFLEGMKLQFEAEAMHYDSLVGLEFPDLELNIPGLYAHAARVRADLPTFKQQTEARQKNDQKWRNVSKTGMEYTEGLEAYYARNLVVAYKMKHSGDSMLIRVVSYFPDEVLLLGVGQTNEQISEFLHPEPQLEGYRYNQRVEYEFWTHQSAEYLYVMAGKQMETVTAEMLPWPEPDGQASPLQELLQLNTFPDPQLVESVHENIITVRTGEITIDHPVLIPAGYQLNIKQGTTINLVNKAAIISWSPVFIKGTADHPVLITSSDFSGNGLTVLQVDKRSKLEHVTVSNMNTLDYKGWTLTGAVTFYESDVDISNMLFYRNQCEDALNTIRSDFKVENATFDNIFSDAFDSDFCTGLVTRSKFTQVGNDAIDFSGSTITITDTEITECNDKGISGGEHSYLTVENTRIERCNIGIASKDLSVVQVKNSSVTDCNYGIVLLQKKPEYGPAKLVLINTPIENSKMKHLIEKGSEVEIDGKLLKGDRENLADIFY